MDHDNDTIGPSRPVALTTHSAHPVTERWWIHVVLLVAAFFSAVVANALLQTHEPTLPRMMQQLVENPARLASGLPFAFALMAILLAHEMGHYLTARYYRVDQSLPYFIPAPTIFGTLGALIVMRSQPENRRVLLHVAVAGPFAGLVVALPLAVFGLMHSTPVFGHTGVEAQIFFGHSLLFAGFVDWFGPGTAWVNLHPVAEAAWVGLFVTSLNLIPAAQLDGGHVAYALFGERHERVSKVVLGFLFVLGMLLGMEQGELARGAVWIFWSVLLFVIGVGHPPVRNLHVPLSLKHRALGVLALILFVITFVPVPIDMVTPAKHRLLQEQWAPMQKGSQNGPAEEFRL